MATIQLRRIINATSGVLQNHHKYNLVFIKFIFRLQNWSNLNASIQIFFCLHKSNSLFPIPMSSFASQLLNKDLHLNAMIFDYKVFSRLHLITNLWIFLPGNDYWRTLWLQHWRSKAWNGNCSFTFMHQEYNKSQVNFQIHWPWRLYRPYFVPSAHMSAPLEFKVLNGSWVC